MTACFPFAAAASPATVAVAAAAAAASTPCRTSGKNSICFVKQTTMAADQDARRQIIARWVRALLTRLRQMVARRSGPRTHGLASAVVGGCCPLVRPVGQSVCRSVGPFISSSVGQSKRAQQDTEAGLMSFLSVAVSLPPPPLSGC